MCNFIMIMILLVTAYTGMAKKPAGHRIGEGYNKYSRRPRVRTAPMASLPVFTAMPCWWTLHRAAARSTRHLKQQGFAIGIIE